ncbi:MAG TPA: isochorismatase family protein [Actinomycetota bacterium]
MGWRELIPPADLEVYGVAGYGGRMELGRRPACLVIDVTYGFVGKPGLSLRDAIRVHPNACGPSGWKAVPRIREVLDAARAASIPVFYTAGMSRHVEENLGRWRDKHRRTLERPPDTQVIVEEIAPGPGEVLIEKTKPSAFFGTPLTATLIDLGIDSVIVAGCTTSGCVRASVTDAFSYGFRVAVVEDGTFDRAELPHAVNLFDMDSKYANVMPAADVAAYLRSLQPGRDADMGTDVATR